MQKYVVGFLIDVNKNVVLIRKNRPTWQAGKLNGVGGKVEPGEDIYNAMCREFTEEAGVIFTDWNLLTKLTESEIDEPYELYVYRGFVEDVTQIEVKTMTSEVIEVHNIVDLFNQNILPSAMWLVVMALDHNTAGFKLEC